MPLDSAENEGIKDTNPQMSSKDWVEWLQTQDKKWRETYRVNPTLFISHYHSEQAFTRDYEGREIFELLQNASDAAAERKINGKVCIDLSKNGLIVVNTGAPFTKEGITSLQTTNVSPKRHKKNQFVGNKGLGFRAVLNWSRFPIIISESLSLVYCQEEIEKQVQVLVSDNPELKKLVQDENTGSSFIAPILVFPSYSENADLSNINLNPTHRDIFGKCLNFLSIGYNTAIGMPFDQPNAYEIAKKQITALSPELLLFIPHIEEIIIKQEDAPEIHWRRESDEKHVRVLINGDAAQEWKIFRSSDVIPSDILQTSQMQWQMFDIAVAIPTREKKDRYPLYSFFPVDIPLPLPCICHATLDLAQSRNHLYNNDVNKFVLKKLAELLVKTVTEIESECQDDPWYGCDNIIPRGELGPELDRLGLYQAIIEEAKKAAIIPTLDEKYHRPEDVRIINGASKDWLPLSQFGDIVLHREKDEPGKSQDAKFLKDLGIVSLDIPAFSQRLSQIKNLSIQERASLISGMIAKNVPTKLHSSILLLDSAGNSITEQTRVFLPPTEGKTITHPEWANIRFLNEELKSEIQKRLQISDMRDLQRKMSNFQVVEYSLENIIRGLQNSAKRKIQETPSLQLPITQELLRTIFSLFNSQITDGKRAQFPQDSTLLVPNISGNFVDAKHLYFNHHFSKNGPITEDLYGSWASEKILASPDYIGLTGEPLEIFRFLQWIGIAEFPRYSKISVSQTENSEFLKYIISSLKYPAQFNDTTCKTPSDVKAAKIDEVQTLDGLEGILINANPDSILAWLAVDNRAAQWIRSSDDHGKISIIPDNCRSRRYYQGPIPSYIHWKIAHTQWLPTQQGSLLEPASCVIGERAIELLFPQPYIPYEESFSKYPWGPDNLRDAWQKSGVIQGLGILEREELYRLLLQLPEKSPDGKSVQALYLWAINREATIRGDFGPNYHEFIQNGKMWGRFGNNSGYYSVKELLHADTEDIPVPLLEKLKIVSLQKRTGSDKVQRLFGIKPLERDKIKKRITYFRRCEGSEILSNEFDTVKPYLLSLRSSVTASTYQLTRLHSLQLIACSDIDATLEYEDETYELKMNPYDWIIIDNSELYLKVHPLDDLSINSSLFADAIGAAIAPLFELADGGDFARIISCPDNQRIVLLRRMLGKDSSFNIDALKDSMQTIVKSGISKTGFVYQKLVEESESSKEITQNNQHIPENLRKNEKEEIKKEDLPENLEITKKEHTPAQTATTIPLKIQRQSHGGGGYVQTHPIADGVFCEKKALEFEENDTPQRYPILVSHITGYEAPGCDIISFTSYEDKQKFLVDPQNTSDLIARYIEVKSRSNKKARENSE